MLPNFTDNLFFMHYILKNANTNVVVGRCMKKMIKSFGETQNNTHVITVWGNNKYLSTDLLFVYRFNKYVLTYLLQIIC